jgi:hypothetical protein
MVLVIYPAPSLERVDDHRKSGPLAYTVVDRLRFL